MKSKINSSLICSAILGCASLLTTPAHADDETMQDLLKVLRDRGAISHDEFEILHNPARADKEEEVISKAEEEEGFEVRTGYNGLTVESADGAFEFNFGGRVQVDANIFDEDQTNLESGAEIRRARFKAEGTMWRIWGYKFQMDFGEGDTEIKDAYLRFTGLRPISITLGHQKVPFSLQSMTSSNWQVFQQRALMDGFIDNNVMDRRRLGLTVGAHGSRWTNWTANAGFFGEGVDDADQLGENWGTAGRVTFAPIAVATEPFAEATTRVLHFGAAAYYRNFEHDPELAFSARPEAHLAPRLVNTGTIAGAEETLLLGGEVSTVWGSFHAQGEYIHASVGRKNGLPDPGFDGWYVQAGYFLTGESRNYKVNKGRYGRVIPQRIVGQGGWGAWEIAFRYSTIDLIDSGILGGVEDNFTVGINWYATPNIMFRANYIRAETDPGSVPSGFGNIEDINIYTLRAQLVF